MQVYYYEPNDEIFQNMSRQMEEEGIEAHRIDEDFFDRDMSILDKNGNETRGIIISHPDTPSARTNEHIKAIRSSECKNPILIVRDHRRSVETAEMINNGADDVMIRPFKPIEVVARVNAVNRRTHGHIGPSVTIGNIVAYLDGRDPEIDGERMELTQREHAIFSHLALNAGRVISKGHIFDAVYGMNDNTPFDKVIDVYICKLRKKIQQRTGQQYIETVYGRGYMLSAPEQKEEKAEQTVESAAEEIKQGHKAKDFVGQA